MKDLKTISEEITALDERERGTTYKMLRLVLEAYSLGYEDGKGGKEKATMEPKREWYSVTDGVLPGESGEYLCRYIYDGKSGEGVYHYEHDTRLFTYFGRVPSAEITHWTKNI